MMARPLPHQSVSAVATARRPLAEPPVATVLSPAEYKARLYAKGWTIAALAQRWERPREWVSRQIANPSRFPYLDDALRGLPRIGPPRAVPRDRRRVDHVPTGPGFRYRGYMVVGAVVGVAKAVGTMAEEGMRGIVVSVASDGCEETYTVVFETGEVERFTPDLVDEYLVTTGLEREELQDYIYLNEATVRHDFNSGAFSFWD